VTDLFPAVVIMLIGFLVWLGLIGIADVVWQAQMKELRRQLDELRKEAKRERGPR